MNRSRDLQPYTVWVIVPALETDDPNLQHYYDFESARAEYTRAFEELQLAWQWRSVNILNIESVIDEIVREFTTRPPIVLNLCDGDELNGVPGVSVIRELEKRKVRYSGANEYFYHLTTSKISMKRAFDAAGIPTPAWVVLALDGSRPGGIFKRLGSPLIVKPAVTAGSLGLSVRSVVSSIKEMNECLNELRHGYRGWNLTSGGILAERFIAGREFTTFVVGSEHSAYFYQPAERVFHESLPEKQRFLSFDRSWETYETKSAMPDEEFVYKYAQPEAELYEQLKYLSLAAYRAVGGTGYGRIDIRQDAQSAELFVLEVNAQCGLSEDDNYTDIGAILRFSGENFAQLTRRILHDAIGYRNGKA